jgi:hypothetical protein
MCQCNDGPEPINSLNQGEGSPKAEHLFEMWQRVGAISCREAAPIQGYPVVVFGAVGLLASHHGYDGGHTSRLESNGRSPELVIE